MANKLIEVLQSAAVSRKAEYLVVQDVRAVSSMCDYQVICNGMNTRHTRAISEAMEEQAREMLGSKTAVDRRQNVWSVDFAGLLPSHRPYFLARGACTL